MKVSNAEMGSELAAVGFWLRDLVDAAAVDLLDWFCKETFDLSFLLELLRVTHAVLRGSQGWTFNSPKTSFIRNCLNLLKMHLKTLRDNLIFFLSSRLLN